MEIINKTHEICLINPKYNTAPNPPDLKLNGSD